MCHMRARVSAKETKDMVNYYFFLSNDMRSRM